MEQFKHFQQQLKFHHYCRELSSNWCSFLLYNPPDPDYTFRICQWFLPLWGMSHPQILGNIPNFKKNFGEKSIETVPTYSLPILTLTRPPQPTYNSGGNLAICGTGSTCSFLPVSKELHPPVSIFLAVKFLKSTKRAFRKLWSADDRWSSKPSFPWARAGWSVKLTN